ncbi:MAG: hypothetical protein WCK67_05855 [bacterium]
MVKSLSFNYQSNLDATKSSFKAKEQSKQKTASNPIVQENFKSLYNNKMNLSAIHFGANIHKSDNEPSLKKFLAFIKPGSDYKYSSDFLKNHEFHAVGGNDWKKWIHASAPELLKRKTADAVGDIFNIADFKAANVDKIKTPDYGDKWGRFANYIEIIPRALGKPVKDPNCNTNFLMRDGIMGLVKMIPAIPANPSGVANCILMPGIFPVSYGDGYANGFNESSSLYTHDFKFNAKTQTFDYSADLFPEKLENNGVKMSKRDLIKASNDLAHVKGLKTGVFMVISEDQMKINGQNFRWGAIEVDDGKGGKIKTTGKEMFIKACCQAVEDGYDAIYFDSAKHIGGYNKNKFPEGKMPEDHWNYYEFWDKGNYAGVGVLPTYNEMQEITNEIRQRTGKGDVAFIGERCEENENRYGNMGLNAGLGQIPAEAKCIKEAADKQKHSDRFATGPAASDDNTDYLPNETRIHKVHDVLLENNGEKRLPSLETMADLFPMNISVHDLMQHNVQCSDGKTSDSHYDNLFPSDDNTKNFTQKINEEFAWAASV